MDVWGSIVVAAATSVITLTGTETIRWAKNRAAARHRVAHWDVRMVDKIPGMRGRIAIAENTGDAEAFNVNFTMTGDADFQIHPHATLDKCRPGYRFLVLVESAGTGICRFTWTDARGRSHGPLDIIPTL